MIDLSLLNKLISEYDNVYDNIDSYYIEISKSSSRGIIRILQYLVNSKLILWSRFFNRPDVMSTLNQINENIDLSKSSPSAKNIFKPYEYCNPNNIRVLIVGMDPYPQVIQGIRVATGNTFEINAEIEDLDNYIGASYRNFLEELNRDLSTNISRLNYIKLYQQGVMMLNFAHTVDIGSAKNTSGSHIELWASYFNLLLDYIVSNNKNIVVVVLGKSVSYKIENLKYRLDERYIVTSHPSRPTNNSSSFTNSSIFSKINALLEVEIDWSE